MKELNVVRLISDYKEFKSVTTGTIVLIYYDKNSELEFLIRMEILSMQELFLLVN